MKRYWEASEPRPGFEFLQRSVTLPSTSYFLVKKRTAALPWVLVVLLVAPWCAAAPTRAVPCAGTFTLGSHHRVFDGVKIDSILLISSAVTLTSDTFGSWTPQEGAAAEPDALVLRNRRFNTARVDLCLINKDSAPRSDELWTAYVGRVGAGLGEKISVLEQADSTKGAPAIAIVGWPTREALFHYPGPLGEGLLAEHHFVVSGRSAALLFVLSGPVSDVAKTTADFRFFISRLALVK